MTKRNLVVIVLLIGVLFSGSTAKATESYEKEIEVILQNNKDKDVVKNTETLKNAIKNLKELYSSKEETETELKKITTKQKDLERRKKTAETELTSLNNKIQEKNTEKESLKQEKEKTTTTTKQDSKSTTQSSVVTPSRKTITPSPLTSEAGQWANNFSFTYIGDSLGVGAQSYLQSYFPNSDFDVLSSRAIVADYGAVGLSGIEVLRQAKSNGTLKKHLVVALGTNDDVTFNNGAYITQFMNEVPDYVETITWIGTASEGGVNYTGINSTIKSILSSYSKASFLDWKSFVDNNGGWASYSSSDSIHMNPSGAEAYAKFHVQGLYELYGG